jgi:sterol desaturase/sphingolipid hydroxylase (fatty acid hydroxylase superfamily)
MSNPSVSEIQGRRLGSGWISGVGSALCGAVGLGAVLCFLFPAVLTVPALRELYPVPYIRALLHFVLVSSFVLGVISVCLRRRKILGMIGISLTLIATLLGGSRIPVEGDLAEAPFLGLDWFMLNLIVFSAVFIPLERLFARRPEQPVLRLGWRTDLIYFFVSALLVQVTTLLTVKPAMVFFRWAEYPQLQVTVAGLPFGIQFAAILFLTDLFQYWIHRIFHTVPALWRFHAVHHSEETMDWLAGSRLHLVDVAVTRGLTYIPIYILGFGAAPLYAYVAFVSFQATFIHSNVRFGFGPLRWLVATPQFHHWHHGIEREAIDKNFAVHLPVLDWMFGTYHLPGERWPAAYGINSSEKVPEGYVKQFVHPFVPAQKDDTSS